MARKADGYLVRSVGVADFHVSSTLVVATPVPGSTESAVRSAFASEVIPILHQLDGRPALHASAVAVGDRAVAFSGPSGRGKSTVAALLCRDPRFRLLSDDSVPLEVDEDGAVWALPTSADVRLRPASARALDEVGEVVFDKHVVPRAPADRPQQLALVCALGEPAVGVTLEALKPRDAVAFLAGHVQRMDPRDVGLLRAEFDFLDRVARGVRVLSLRYPHDFDASALTDALLRELGEPAP